MAVIVKGRKGVYSEDVRMAACCRAIGSMTLK